MEKLGQIIGYKDGHVRIAVDEDTSVRNILLLGRCEMVVNDSPLFPKAHGRGIIDDHYRYFVDAVTTAPANVGDTVYLLPPHKMEILICEACDNHIAIRSGDGQIRAVYANFVDLNAVSVPCPVCGSNTIWMKDEGWLEEKV